MLVCGFSVFSIGFLLQRRPLVVYEGDWWVRGSALGVDVGVAGVCDVCVPSVAAEGVCVDVGL